MWIDVQQNSEEWFNLRLKRITSSNFDIIMANEYKSFGNPAIQYAQKKALEIVTNELDDSASYSSKYMDRGVELEPIAKEMYERETFYDVQNGGFNSVGYNLGDSPDGNILKKGCIEIKCVIPNTQWKRLKKGGYDLSYKWQIQGHLWLGEKDWCDFVSYCPEMPINKQIYIFRVYKDDEMIERLKKRINKFIKEIEMNVKILTKN